jgi:superoxide dismutase, Fe-Mn family
MPITLPELPYPRHALEPHLSRETLDFHYGKHHQTYVETTNDLIAGTPREHLSLDQLVREASGELFNNAAQVWNHNFYWNCLSPDQQRPDPDVERALKAAFGGYDAFKQKFTDAALKRFGSGWTWLVRTEDGGLKVLSTANADNPLVDGQQPLLVCDVWEHAYYIDYRNARPEYLKHFWPLVNWSFVASNLAATADLAALT